jgi:RHS repeat-associated protein
VSVSAAQGDALWLEFHSSSVPKTKVLASSANVGTAADDPSPVSTPADYYATRTDVRFGPLYRQWGQFVYNGNGTFGTNPIDETVLVTPTPTAPNTDFNGISDPTTLENKLNQEGFDPAKQRFIMMVPDFDTRRWLGFDNLSWVQADQMSSSRLGDDDLTSTSPVPSGTARAIVRTIESTNKSFSIAGGVSAGGFGASGGPSFSTGSTRTLADFMDMNGDRYPDIISSGSIQYTTALGALEALARGSNLETPRSERTDAEGVTAGGSYSQAKSGERSMRNIHEASMNEPSLGLNGSFGRSHNEEEFGWADVNGDGLPDRVYRGGDVALNLGYRFAPRENWGFGQSSKGQGESASAGLGFNIGAYSIGGGVSVSRSDNESQETLLDVNGDGLPDKIIVGNPIQVAINRGSDFLPPVPWTGASSTTAGSSSTEGASAYFTICIPLPPIVPVVKLCFNPGGGISQNMGRQLRQLSDIDGDGYADFLTSSTDDVLSVARSTIGRTNLLKKVHRPLGATFDFEYTRDGNTFDLPQSRWVMTKLTMFDGHVGEGADRQVATYGYSGSNYNRLEREFYGYGTVIERHLDTQNANALFRSIQRDYLTTSYYTKGLLARELTSDALARPFLETQNTYVLRDAITSAEPVDGTSTTATIFPQLTRADKRLFESGTVAQKATATVHEYDALGNMTRFNDTGDVGAQDDAFAVINYTSNDPACQSSYIVGKPNKIVVTGNGATMRNREASIDCATGNVRQVRQFLETGQVAVTDLDYFPNGNIQSVTGPSNRNAQRYRLDYLYDATVDTHVARVTDSFGLFSTAEHDLRFGKPTTTADINGQRVTYSYDNAGRVDTVVGPYEQGTGQITIGFAYAPVQTPTSDTAGNTIPLAQVPFAFTRHIDKDADGALKSSGTIDTVLFTDGLKRVIQIKKDDAVHATPDGTPQDVMTVSGQVAFDAFGQTVAQFYPTTEPKGTNTLFNPTFDAVAPTTMTYDVLDRNTRTTIPDGTFTTMVYGFGADRLGLTQFQTTRTDANGKVRQTYRDVRELITSVKELNQGATVWTSYAYDPLKQIVRIEDDKHNVTTAAYDNFGRRTVIDNPDAGRTETQYDLSGNVIARITANLRATSQQISYNYDFNRLTAITYPAFPGNNVTYAYGAPSAAGDKNGNRAGLITTITSQMGTEERFYGPLGEITKEVKTVNTFTTPNAPEVYTTLYRFDTWNRLMRLTYPDGEILTYAYDSGGLVNFAQGQKSNFTYSYINRLEYDKFEQRAFVEAGNNVRTRYAYDERTRRLCSLTSAKGTGGTPTCVTSLDGTLPVQNNIQNLLYVYDNVGNIRGEANSIPVPPPSQFGGPTKQTFVYDDLYRLTQGSGTFSFNPSKTQTYSMIMAYDSIHNIVSKNQSDIIAQPSGTPITQKKTSYLFNYAYGSPHPHAPTHIGNRTFSYDANGNQLGWDNDDNGTRRTIVWDEENRTQSLFDNGHEKTYKYDDQGQRIIKRGPQGETVYVNQYFTIRNKEIGTKHVFAGTSRLVSKLMKQDKPGANPQGKTPVEKDLYFFHPDHLGSSHYITDTQGQIFEHLEYFPFGETWVEESTNTQRTPYLFTGKEFDEETNLYYYGARYYDPRTSVWQSADPSFVHGQYFVDLTNPEHQRKEFAPLAGLPGGGGVFNSRNFAVFTYTHQNPVKLTDPSGELPFLVVTAGAGAIIGGAAGAIISYRQTGEVSWKAVAGGAAAGAAIGLGSGAGVAYFTTGTVLGSTGGVIIGASTTWTTTTAALSGGAGTLQLLIRNAQNATWTTITTTSGQIIRIGPSAVKHLQEFAARSQSFTSPLNLRLLNESYIKAVDKAVEMGIKYGEKMNVGGWELICERARDSGAPILMHALML